MEIGQADRDRLVSGEAKQCCTRFEIGSCIIMVESNDGHQFPLRGIDPLVSQDRDSIAAL